MSGKSCPVCFIYSTLASCCRKTYTLGKLKHSFPWKNQKHQPLAPSWCTRWSSAREESVPAGSSPQQPCRNTSPAPAILPVARGAAHGSAQPQLHRHPASPTFHKEPSTSSVSAQHQPLSTSCHINLDVHSIYVNIIT